MLTSEKLETSRQKQKNLEDSDGKKKPKLSGRHCVVLYVYAWRVLCGELLVWFGHFYWLVYLVWCDIVLCVVKLQCGLRCGAWCGHVICVGVR